jgi:hypothetical protein
MEDVKHKQSVQPAQRTNGTVKYAALRDIFFAQIFLIQMIRGSEFEILNMSALAGKKNRFGLNK